MLEEECSRANYSSTLSSHLRLRVMKPPAPEEPTRPPLQPDTQKERKDVTYFVDKYLKLAGDAYQKRQFTLALKYAKRAAEIGSAAPCPNPSSPSTHTLRSKLADSSEFQADCELSLGRDKEALELYRQAASMRATLYHTDKHLSLAGCISNVCRIYRRHHAYSLALHYALYLRDIYQYNGMTESVHMAMALSHVSAVKKCQGLYTEALELEKEGLNMRLRILSGTHPAVARSYHW